MVHEKQKNAIYEQAFKVVESMKNPVESRTGIPTGFGEELRKLQEIIHKIQELSEYISDQDVHDFFFFRLTMIEKLDIKSIDHTSLNKAIDNYFFSKPRVVDFYFRISRAGDFPDGFEVGTGSMISYDNLPEDVRTSLSNHWKLFFEDDKFSWEKGVEEYAERQKRYSYIHCSVTSIGSFKLNDKAFKEVRKNTNILKFVYGDSFYGEISSIPYLYCWKAGKGTGAHISNASRPDEFFRIPFLDDRVKEISKIIRNQRRDEIEQKIVNAIEICGLIEHETPIHVRFLLKMICLEALLLGKTDKDYLGWKLAEKISLLIGNSKAWLVTYLKLKPGDTVDEQLLIDNKVKARIGLEKAIKDLYDTRSTFAHGDVSDNTSNSELEGQYGLISDLLFWITEKLLQLHSSGIKKISKENTYDETALDHYIQTLKYTQ